MISHINGLLVFIEMKQKKNISASGRLKKTHFPALPIPNICSREFHGLIFGLVGLIHVKAIGVAQPQAQKQPKNTKK